MVQVDGAGSDSLVDPGVACWVGISGAPEAREERGLSAWQFGDRRRSCSSPLGLLFSPCPLGGDFGYPEMHRLIILVKYTLHLCHKRIVSTASPHSRI